MIFTFKNRNIPLFKVDIEVSEKQGVRFKRIVTNPKYIYPETLPFALQEVQKSHLNLELEEWFKRRAIPKKREGLQELMDNLFNTSVKRPYETAQILSLCSYGTAITDGYWFCPKDDFMLNLPGHPLNGFVIQAHPKYAGLAQFEAPVYKHCVQGNKNVSMDWKFLAQDFTMNGLKKKYISKEEDGYYVNKIYPNAKEYTDALINCMRAYPKYVAPARLLKDEDGHLIGHSNKLGTSEMKSFVSLEDLCLCVNAPKVNWVTVCKAFEHFGLSRKYLDDFKDIKTDYYPKDLYPDKSFYQNAGFIYNNRDMSIIEPIIWF